MRNSKTKNKKYPKRNRNDKPSHLSHAPWSKINAKLIRKPSQPPAPMHQCILGVEFKFRHQECLILLVVVKI